MKYVQVTLEFEVRDEDDIDTAIGLACEVRARADKGQAVTVKGRLPNKIVNIYIGDKNPTRT